MIITTIIGADSLTLDVVKKHLNIDFIDDDDYLSSLISVSLNAVENYCRADFIEREHTENFGSIKSGAIPKVIISSLTKKPHNDIIELQYEYMALVQSLFIPYQNLINLGDNNYIFKNSTLEVYLVESLGIDVGTPLIMKWQTGAITIEQAINQARLLLIGTYYENRESDVVGMSTAHLPSGVRFLLEPYTYAQVG